MAPDLPNRPSATPRLHHDSSRRDLQSPRHPQEKPLAGATASPWSALVRALPVSLRDLPSSATPPTSAPLPARIAQSKASGNYRADRAPLREARSPGQVFPFPTAPATHWPRFEPFPSPRASFTMLSPVSPTESMGSPSHFKHYLKLCIAN